MAKRNRFFTIYLTTTMSVALVLYLVGLECVGLLSSQQLVRQLQEDVALSVLIADKADSAQIHQLGLMLDTMPYCHHWEYISKEQALADHISALGEDPEQFLGYNPLSNSYEVHLNAPYVVEDSIRLIQEALCDLPTITLVNYPDQVVSVLNLRLGKFHLILLIVAAALLLISLVLIINTVRLHVYSKRFIINTMRLVGATPWVIRAPFIHRNLLMGLESGLLALTGVVATVYLVHLKLGFWLFAITWYNMLFVTIGVMGIGLLVTLVASLIATSMYIRMKTDKLYEV